MVPLAGEFRLLEGAPLRCLQEGRGAKGDVLLCWALLWGEPGQPSHADLPGRLELLYYFR